MQEQCVIIGETAGKIYRAIQGNSGKTIDILKRETKVSDALINQGIGWLAREGKIELQTKGGNIVIALVSSEACRM